MNNKKNSGFSMIEIVISVAIFAILITPIVGALISSSKQTTSGKELQYRNEFAQNLLEYAKEDSLDNIKSLDYFKSLGSYDVSYSEDLNKYKLYRVTDPTTGKKVTKKAPYQTYTLKGSMNLGPEHTKYSYVMQIGNEYYANKQATDNTYVNPNNLALGVVEDIDYTKVALINGTIANYDAAVTSAFMTRKLQVIKELDPSTFEQFINQLEANNPFRNDRVQRQIIIKVSDSVEAGKKQYKVTCTLRYTDDSKMSFKSGKSLKQALIDKKMNTIEYVPYAATFDELPNIYLMYNVCVYNGIFSDNDYVLYDLADLSDDQEVNVFVVETATTYSEDLRDVQKKEIEANTELSDEDKESLINALNSKVLYNNETVNASSSRDEVNIYMAARGDAVSGLHVYHNFDTYTDGTAKPNTKNTKVKFDVPINLSAGERYEALTDHATVGKLDEATQESRGLYQVKVWMSEGDIEDVDISKDPMISGTKGGSES